MHYVGWRNGKQKQKLRFVRKMEESSSHLGFPISWLLFNLQVLFPHLNFSDSGADCCRAVRTSGLQKSGNKESVFYFFCRSRIDFIYMCLIFKILLLLPLCESQSISIILSSVFLMGTSILATDVLCQDVEDFQKFQFPEYPYYIPIQIQHKEA